MVGLKLKKALQEPLLMQFVNECKTETIVAPAAFSCQNRER